MIIVLNRTTPGGVLPYTLNPNRGRGNIRRSKRRSRRKRDDEGTIKNKAIPIVRRPLNAIGSCHQHNQEIYEES